MGKTIEAGRQYSKSSVWNWFIYKKSQISRRAVQVWPLKFRTESAMELIRRLSVKLNFNSRREANAQSYNARNSLLPLQSMPARMVLSGKEEGGYGQLIPTKSHIKFLIFLEFHFNSIEEFSAKLSLILKLLKSPPKAKKGHSEEIPIKSYSKITSSTGPV